MVVDDEPFFLDILREFMITHGYQASAFQSSTEALVRLRETPQKFDAIITDQTMPEMTGVQLAAEIKMFNPQIPIILCTGYSETITEETAKNYGIAKFLMKPITRDELARALHDVLQPSEK